MSVERSGKSHAAAWTLSILAVPVLYVLSVGPMAYFFIPLMGDDPQPEWFNYYGRPYRVLYFNTPLRGVMDSYEGWWARRAGPIKR
ncbi:hypothetical protein AYO49_03405 [Verrucomicrobiaceae bacterium SCGC AG-212-N21]|nr:hypothetical protein AYO49_03405 [Verrucomicrobiaceae bacterium SCGC AG-212-N21]